MGTLIARRFGRGAPLAWNILVDCRTILVDSREDRSPEYRTQHSVPSGNLRLMRAHPSGARPAAPEAGREVVRSSRETARERTNT